MERKSSSRRNMDQEQQGISATNRRKSWTSTKTPIIQPAIVLENVRTDLTKEIEIEIRRLGTLNSIIECVRPKSGAAPSATLPEEQISESTNMIYGRCPELKSG